MCSSLLLMGRVFLLVLIGTVYAQAQAQAQAQSVTLGERLASYRSFTADFTQTSTDASGGILEVTQGKIWLSTPDRFRIESSEPVNQTLVSDGKQLWNYDVDLEQVIISQLDRGTIPVLLMAQTDEEIEAAYELGYFEDEIAEVYVLAPKQPDSVFASLSFEFIDGKLSALMIRDGLGQATQIQFASLVSNEAIDVRQFTFQVPEDVEVIHD